MILSCLKLDKIENRQIVCYVIGARLMATLTRHFIFPNNTHDGCVVLMVVAFFMRLLWYPLFTVLMLCYAMTFDAFTKTLPMLEIISKSVLVISD